MGFVHLHTHTEYSLLDGSNKIKEYVARVKELNMNAAAITDHGVMYGVIDFYNACTEAGINPVIGCEVYVSPGSRFDKEAGMSEDRYHHLVLLAENDAGYHNLMKIVSVGFTEGYYYKPRVDMETLEKYHEGLICLSACLAGEIPRDIIRGLNAEAEKAALRYQEIFGEGNFFLELQDHGIREQQLVDQTLISMSEKLNIPLVCTNDCHYTKAEDAGPHDILLCLQTGKKLSDTDRMKYEGGQYYVKSEEEMRRLFSYVPEALENTQKIADRCHVEIKFHEMKLPHFDVPDEFADSWEYLNHLCDRGFKERYPSDDGSIYQRMQYELSVIRTMGFIDYFLIVWDYINFAKENDIPVGPGRGSAAGSVVSYALRITDIDPVKNELLFERFLNPERTSMPDIDVDFDPGRRQEVIDYVVQKYGRSKCVQIVTFGTLAAKGVIRDVTRVMDLPYAFGDNLSKMVPNELNITLKRALEENNDLRKLYETDEQVKHVIDMSMRLEGLPRHTSIHAAGILITPEAADEYVPLSRGSNGEITTQFTMNTLERLGLLKMDFLGLRNLSVIQSTVRFINAKCGASSTPTGDPSLVGKNGAYLDIDLIDYDDAETLEFIATGETDGIFQLESGGMQRFIKELKPECLEDVIAGIALYRPGPMDFIPQYIAGKKNRDNVSYLCPELEPILKPTYGCIVYQEQVMQIFRDLAGYSLGGADIIRRAMSKKKQKDIDENQNIFVYGGKVQVNGALQEVPGCIAKGIKEDVALKIYASINDFAKYAFNKSHAACYAYVTMQTAFLKHYYPVEFMASLMTSVLDNPTKLAVYMLSARAMGIELLPPDINKAVSGFSPADDKGIRYGLSAIKAVGIPVIQAVERERKENGYFKSFSDFIDRMAGTEVNRRTIEAFIKAGVFDSLGGNRRQYMEVYEQMLDSAVRAKKDSMAGQMSIFDVLDEGDDMRPKDALPDLDEYPEELKLSYEKEVLGIYLTGHPLMEYMELLRSHTDASSTDFLLNKDTNMIGLKEGKWVTIGGLISSVKRRQTKKGDTMAILFIEDMLGAVECIAWPKIYAEYRDELAEDAKVLLKGRVKADDEKDGQLMIDEVIPFENIGGTLYIRFEDMGNYRDKSEELDSALAASEGHDRVMVYLNKEKKQKLLPESNNVHADTELLTSLKNLFGEENVRFVG